MSIVDTGSSKPTGRLPDFFLIGAMKAGTTSLYYMLDNHPNIFLSNPKEPEFFSSRFETNGAEAWYRALFQEVMPGQICGDCSTGYARNAYPVAARLHKAQPYARLIYLLRHPVERSWSHYLHRMNERIAAGDKALSFDRALLEYPEIIDASLYIQHIRTYMQHFSRDQLLPILFDDLRSDTGNVMRQMYQFLDVEPHDAIALQHANPAGELTGRREIKSLIDRLRGSWLANLAKQFIPKSLRRFLIDSFIQSPAVLWLAKKFRGTAKLPTTPDKEVRAKLLEIFHSENLELEQWLGRTLPRSWYR